MDLERNRIQELLGLLDDELVRQGHRATVYVVGGANIALAVDGERGTEDIDVVIKNGLDHLRAAALEVARQESLPADWINSQFAGADGGGGITWQWMDNKESDEPTVAYSGQGLHVELASPEMMLALKTLATRPQDVRDAHKLMRMTGIGIKDPGALGRNLARFTGPRIFRSQSGPGMFLKVDPYFAHIYESAPDDIRPETIPRRRPRRLRAFVSMMLQRVQSARGERKRSRGLRKLASHTTVSTPSPATQSRMCGRPTASGDACRNRAGSCPHHR